MRKNLLTLALTALVAGSVFGTVCLLMLYQQSVKDMSNKREQKAYLENQQTALPALAYDLRIFAKTHPDLVPVLRKNDFNFDAEGTK